MIFTGIKKSFSRLIELQNTFLKPKNEFELTELLFQKIFSVIEKEKMSKVGVINGILNDYKFNTDLQITHLIVQI